MGLLDWSPSSESLKEKFFCSLSSMGVYILIYYFFFVLASYVGIYTAKQDSTKLQSFNITITQIVVIDDYDLRGLYQ